MQTTRARVAGLFGVLVIAITWIVWHPSTLSGTRYVGLEVVGNNQGTAAGAFEQVSPTTTPAPVARDNGGLRPQLQGDGTGQPAAAGGGRLRRPAAALSRLRHRAARGDARLVHLWTGVHLQLAGRGGRIFRVDTLADNRAAPVALGDGTFRSSLRAAVEAEGPRVVVFETLRCDLPDRAACRLRAVI